MSRPTRVDLFLGTTNVDVMGDENVTRGPEPTDAEVALTLGTLVLRLLNGEEFSLVDEIQGMPPVVVHLMLAALLLIVAEQIDKGALTTTDFAPTEDR